MGLKVVIVGNKLVFRFAIAISILLSGWAAFAQEEINPLGLAALLIRDGNYARAKSQLEQVKPSTEEELRRYHTLYGLLYLQEKSYKAAMQSLHEALHHHEFNKKNSDEQKWQKTATELNVFLAQAEYGGELFDLCEKRLTSAGESIYTKTSIYSLHAACAWQAKKQNLAFEILRKGELASEDKKVFERQRILFFIDGRLFHNAYEHAMKMMARSDFVIDDFLTIAQAFRAVEQFQLSLEVLQAASLRFANEPRSDIYEAASKIYSEMAINYLHLGKERSSAELFERAAMYDAKYLSEAVEMYRRAHLSQKAVYLMSQIPDKGEMLKQKLAFFLEQGDFAQAVALERPLYFSGLYANQDILYALAYSHYQLKNLSRVDAYLGELRREDLFKKAMVLRESIEQCRENQWQCL